MLKLTVSRGDKILIGEDIILEVKTLSEKQTQLAFSAPLSVKIRTIFKDLEKQFVKS